MSNQDNFTDLMSAILGKRLVRITPKDGQSLEDAIAEHEAAHRKECPDCAAEHEAELKAAAAGGADKQFDAARAAVDKANKHADEMTKSDKTKDNVAERAEALIGAAAVVVGRPANTADDIGIFVIQVPPGSPVKIGTDLYLGDTPAPTEAPKRQPIGYMVFGKKDGLAIKGSFDTDRAALEKKMEKFDALPELAMMRSLMSVLGGDLRDMLDAEIRPVFGA